MIRLEDLQPNAAVRGLLPDCLVTVVSVQWFGSEALELTYKTPAGKVANELLYRNDEPRLELVEQGRPWSFDGDGALFRLVSEANRIRLAHLFDPVLAVHTSIVDPLPHQITAVYETMLPRQPLRFLLADDPGAGKRQYEDRSDPRVLDIMDVPLLDARPKGYQQENWLLDPNQYWVNGGRAHWNDLQRLAEPYKDACYKLIAAIIEHGGGTSA
jgi:hypothetical protein